MSRQRSIEAVMASEYVSIGELARITEMRYSTLKHYTESGILPFEQEDENLTRRYRREDSIARLEQIKQLKDTGLSIKEISACLVGGNA